MNKTLINHILEKNHVDIKKTITTALARKVSEQLSNRKTQIAKESFVTEWNVGSMDHELETSKTEMSSLNPKELTKAKDHHETAWKESEKAAEKARKSKKMSFLGHSFEHRFHQDNADFHKELHNHAVDLLAKHDKIGD